MTTPVRPETEEGNMSELAQETHQMKMCPRCAEDIRVEALVCRFCGAEFTTTKLGYCATCHHSVTPNDDVRCPACGSELLDLRTVSEVLTPAEPAPPTPIATAGSAARRAEPSPVMAPTGRLREAIVPAGKQRIGYRLLSVSAGLLFALLLFSVIGLGVASTNTDPSPFTYWHKRSLGWATEFGGPPIFLFLLIVPVLLFQPKLVRPSGIAAWLKGRSYVREFRKHYGEAPLRASSRKTMAVGSLITWSLVLLTCIGFLVTQRDDRLVELGIPPFIALLLAALGVIGSLLFLSTSASRTVQMADDGTVYG